MNIQDYLKDRVEDQASYYRTKARTNKNYYQFFKVTQIIAAALLPFLSAFIARRPNITYVIAFLGTIITIIEGLLAIGKYHEKWINYRATAEALKQEKFLFLMKSGSYYKEDAAVEFVNRIEMLLAKENSGWQQLIIKEKEAGKKDNNGSAESNDGSSTSSDVVNPKSNNTSSAFSNTSDNDEVSPPLDPLTGISTPEDDTTIAGNNRPNSSIIQG